MPCCLLELEIKEPFRTCISVFCPNYDILHACVSPAISLFGPHGCVEMTDECRSFIGWFVYTMIHSSPFILRVWNLEYSREAIYMFLRSFLFLVQMHTACSFHPISHSRRNSLNQRICSIKTAYLPSLTFL